MERHDILANRTAYLRALRTDKPNLTLYKKPQYSEIWEEIYNEMKRQISRRADGSTVLRWREDIA
jgi:hypothetical protein